MKIKTRLFKLKNALPDPFFTWTNEVIEGIEKDVLLVYNPKDEKSFCNGTDKNGTEILLSRAKTPISIREWLCIGCQCIRWHRGIDGDTTENSVACYKQNGRTVIWPEYAECRPDGPAAFIGEILIQERRCDKMDKNEFKCIIAHELIHVFDVMQYLVPAFIDWRSFWKCVLVEGSRCDILLSQLEDKGHFVDSYGQKNELAMMKSHWPVQSKAWFKAFRLKNKGKGKNNGKHR